MKKFLYDVACRLMVSKCPSCGAVVKYPGTLCDECTEKYGEERARACRFCKLPADVCVCNTRELYFCRRLDRTMCSLIFYDPQNEVFMRALAKLKYSSDRGAERLFARELALKLLMIFAGRGEMSHDWVITYPPRRRASVTKYGFDQARGLAKRVSEFCGASFEEVFVHRGKAEQKSLGSVERAKNAKDSYFLKKKADVAGKNYIIIDDIVTSGATMTACQELLFEGGASSAFAMSVAKTPLRGAGYDSKKRYRRKTRIK